MIVQALDRAQNTCPGPFDSDYLTTVPGSPLQDHNSSFSPRIPPFPDPPLLTLILPDLEDLYVTIYLSRWHIHYKADPSRSHSATLISSQEMTNRTFSYVPFKPMVYSESPGNFASNGIQHMAQSRLLPSLQIYQPESISSKFRTSPPFPSSHLMSNDIYFTSADSHQPCNPSLPPGNISQILHIFHYSLPLPSELLVTFPCSLLSIGVPIVPPEWLHYTQERCH